ncbi:MAG: lipoprotein signal peptidase [Gemmatimonadaceae bacterium]|nr:lipoprotein signal peptidase [Chitinophagaceae bacterium]
MKQLKPRNIVLLIVLILLVDQALKVWVKTSMPLSRDWDEFHTMLTPYDKGIRPLGGDWFQIYFVENPGMAWGMELGGEWGKMALTLFRLIAVIAGVFILRNFIRKQYHRGFIICAALIFAGALGNLIDSMFYGIIFDESTHFHVASLFPPKGYAGFLHGKVVDMLYFPIIKDKILPEWLPFWGGERFTFFSPVFNIADASISAGVIAILLFQKRFFKKPEEPENPVVETNTPVDDKVQVL